MRGRVLTFTRIHVAAAQSGPVPFVVAVVETADGERLTVRIGEAGHGDLAIGETLRLEPDDRFGFTGVSV